nr:hypothetical protein [Candidatus Levybacteria bacterium]
MKEQKKKEEKIEWDRKKIVIFLFLVLFLIIAGYELKTMVLDENLSKSKSSFNFSNDAVKGADTQQLQLQSSNIKQNIQNEIENLKNEAQNINLVDIASSSPQVQKVINDLKAIQNYPGTQLKQTCEKICSGL